MVTKNGLKLAMVSALIVTSYVTFALVVFNLGFSDGFLVKWLFNWMIAFVLVVPSLLFVAPVIKRALDL